MDSFGGLLVEKPRGQTDTHREYSEWSRMLIPDYNDIVVNSYQNKYVLYVCMNELYYTLFMYIYFMSLCVYVYKYVCNHLCKYNNLSTLYRC